MTRTTSSPEIEKLLIRLGYHETGINNILQELDTLFKDIDFDKLRQAACSAQEAKDTPGLINILKDLMLILENKGYYRPDFPTKLIKLLVNGLNHRNEDIFTILDKAIIPAEEKRKEKEFLASCAAITQLGYILLNSMVLEVKAASAGPHVFIIIDGLSSSVIFADFSIGSILKIDILRYDRKENCYYLKNTADLDGETSGLLRKYYTFFLATAGTGLSHNIHNNLGIAYDRIGRYTEAVEELKEALRLAPAYVEARNNLAVAYDNMGRYDDALMELQQAVRLNPEYTEAHGNLGNLYARSGRYEEAVQELKEALRLNPGYAAAHNNLGNIYALQKRNKEAIEEFQEALRLDPDYAPAHNNLGSTYAELGRYEEALREFQETLRLEPEFPEAYQGMGSVYYSLGSYDRAINAWVRAVYLNPELFECVPEKLILKVRQGVSRLGGRTQL